MRVEKYRKKPVEIEAAQWDGTSFTADAIVAWSGGDVRVALHGEDNNRMVLVVETLEGRMAASPGDWVIRGVQGEFHPIKDAIFRETYEPATDADSPVEYLYRAAFGGDRGTLHVWRQDGTDEWTTTFQTGHAWFSPTREVRWPTARAALNGALAEGVVLADE